MCRPNYHSSAPFLAPLEKSRIHFTVGANRASLLLLLPPPSPRLLQEFTLSFDSRVEFLTTERILSSPSIYPTIGRRYFQEEINFSFPHRCISISIPTPFLILTLSVPSLSIFHRPSLFSSKPPSPPLLSSFTIASQLHNSKKQRGFKQRLFQVLICQGWHGARGEEKKKKKKRKDNLEGDIIDETTT